MKILVELLGKGIHVFQPHPMHLKKRLLDNRRKETTLLSGLCLGPLYFSSILPQLLDLVCLKLVQIQRNQIISLAGSQCVVIIYMGKGALGHSL